MGEYELSENQEFMLMQIKNSITIINQFFDNKELSFTALQNALLSLVLLPFESAKRHDNTRIWQGKYIDVREKIGFSDEVFVPIAECKNGTPKFNNRTQYNFIKKFRNAVAHQNIQIIVNANRFVSVVFFNIFPAKCSKCKNVECKAYSLRKQSNGVEDFKVSFTYNQLHAFAMFVANSYIQSIMGKRINNIDEKT